jgi:hypothetical protein
MPRMRFTIEQYAKNKTEGQHQLGETDKRLFYRALVNECYNDKKCWQNKLHNKVYNITSDVQSISTKSAPHYRVNRAWCVPYKPLPKETANAKDK